MLNKIKKKWSKENDSSCKYVSYKKGIAEADKIPGLAPFVEEESKKIIDYLVSICAKHLGVDEALAKNAFPVHIVLDDDCPKDTYGPIDEKDAIEQMKKLCSEYSDCPLSIAVSVLLYDTLRAKHTIDLINKMIKEFERFDEIYRPNETFANELANELKKILRDVKQDYKRLGEYRHNGYNVHEGYEGHNDDDREIRIFYKNFNSMPCNEYMAQLSHTLAHEIMHALHDCYAPAFFMQRDEKSKAVKEATADFFANMYCIKNGKLFECRMKKIANDRYDAWVKNFKTAWPYHNAIYYMRRLAQNKGFSSFAGDYEEFRCFDKMRAILDENHKAQWRDGYDILTETESWRLRDEDFED